MLIATPPVPTVPHYGQTPVMTSGLQSSGMVPQFLPQGRGQIRQLTDLAAIPGFQQPVYMSMPMGAVRMVHNRPVHHHNQSGVPYLHQDPSYTGPQYSHQQLYYQHPPLYPGISNADNNNRSSPIIQEIEEENEKQNQNSNVIDEDIPEIHENIQKVNEWIEDAKMLPEHAMNETSKDPAELKNNGRVEQSQSNRHLVGPQNTKESTTRKDSAREADFNTSIASMTETCKRKTSPNETSPPALGSETKPKKSKGNSGTSITVHGAIPNLPALQTCRNMEEVDIESQRSSDTNEVDQKASDEMSNLASIIEEIDIKEGSERGLDDEYHASDVAKAGSDKGVLPRDRREGNVFGDTSSVKGKEEKQDTGTDLFTTTSKVKTGTTAAENRNSNEQSITLEEEKPKSNPQKAFCHEKVHAGDRNDASGTGSSPDVANANENYVSKEFKEKVFSKEADESVTNDDPPQKTPVIDTEEAGSDEGASCQTDREGNVFGDPSSIKGNEEKEDTGTDLYTATANIEIGTTAAESRNSGEQSNTSETEKPKSNRQKAFCHEKVHIGDRKDARGTGSSPDVGNTNTNSEIKQKAFSNEETKTVAGCDPLKNKLAINTDGSTDILRRTRQTEQKEKEHETSNSEHSSKPNEHAEVMRGNIGC